MGKALILKNGVDFSANAVVTIEFADIPCTGITFAQNAYTVSGYDDVTVEYTVTPADTTDSVIWTSSNTDIVSISNGVMTINGIGTCTITAICGEFTATATVTVNISYIPKWNFGLPEGQGTYIKWARTFGRILASGSGVQAGTHELVESTATEAHLVPVKLPNNTASVRVSYNSAESAMLVSGTYHGIIWGEDVACGNSVFPDAVKFVSENQFALRADVTETVTVPDGADCMVVYARTATTYTESDDPYSVAESLGLTIEFIPAE